ncbi:MAG: BamA/TamA family outer membrane protein [Chitinispirillaceae bacterium]|nr:BamA/TamA family outer membrane protein [Chitinispirillaceae bacterium]
MRSNPICQVIFIICLLTIHSKVYAVGSTTNDADIITSVIISGNKVTKTETVRYLSGIFVGMPFDSVTIENAKDRLKNTGLFFKVDILTLPGSDGYRIYIVLTEKFYFLPYDLGGELYSYQYGKPKRWWRLRVGVEYSNFRGKAEVLRTSFSVFEWHSFGIGWYKPFLPSPWFFSFGVRADQLPDEIFLIDHSILRSSLTVGRKLPFKSRAEMSVMPMYRRRILFDSSLAAVDTQRVSEAFSMVRWRTDYRDRYFDPTQGWMLAWDFRTNALYSGIAPAFGQFYADFRWYNQGFFPTHRLAARVTSVARTNDAGITHRLQLGGEGSVRGYARGQFGRYFIANNSMTISMEYRFPIYQFPDMDLFLLSAFSPVFSSIAYRLDGALILDHGRISTRFPDLFSTNPSQLESGTGIGAGLRAVTPTLERSVCFDLVWGTWPWAPRGSIYFMKQPMWHWYLDMYF